MARLFTAASGEIAAYTTAAPLTGTPLTLVAWVKLTAVRSVTQTVIGIHDKDSIGIEGRQGWFIGINTGEQVVARTQVNTATAESVYVASTVGTTGFTHCAAVFASDASRIAYYNGLAATEETTSRTPTLPDTVSIGGHLYNTSTIARTWDGDVAEAAIYNVGLTAAEVAMLAAGYSPLMVRPEALVAYWPLVGRNSPETDIVGKYDLTLTGTTASPHPRIIRPSAKILTFPSAAGGTVSAAGTATGTSDAAGIGASTNPAAGTSTGTSDAAAVGSTYGTTEAGAGTSAGTSDAAGVGASTNPAAGTATGTSDAAAVGAASTAGQGEGAAAGTSNAAGVGASTAAVTGTAAGTSDASAVGASTNAATGTATGTSDASGVGAEITATTSAGAGTASGTSDAQAVSGAQALGGSLLRGRRGRYKLPTIFAAEEAYAEIRKNPDIRAELRAIVRPYVLAGNMPPRAAPTTSQVDWDALRHDTDAFYKLIVVWEDVVDEEETLLLLDD